MNLKLKRPLVFFVCTIMLGSAAGAGAQILEIDEAEVAKTQCQAGSKPYENMWSSGGKLSPGDWGAAEGDSIEWRIFLHPKQEGLKLAIRYACAVEPEPGKDFDFSIDGAAPTQPKFPGTRSWDVFDSLIIDLPSLKPGSHTLKLISPAAGNTIAFDCFILFMGDAGKIPPPLQRTTLSTSPNKRFVIRASARVQMNMTQDAIYKQFDRIFDHYERFMGWAPPVPIGINLIEDKLWPDRNSTAFQNGYGVFFRSSAMNREQGNWTHEMVHMFYVAHFPWWFDESSVRTLTAMAFYPALFKPGEKREREAGYLAAARTGKEVLANPGQKFDHLEPIHNAMCVKYGPEVFSRFFHACTEAGKKGELDFTPGRHVKRDEIMKYLSQAAGEDVTPMYRQWNGFDNAE